MLTNKLNLPMAFVMAVQNDPYTRGNSDISVTQLIAPPFQRKLRETVEPIEDVSQRTFSLYGQITHGILERSGLKHGLDVEERLYADINGWKVSGQYDLIVDGILQDWKFTTFWSVKGDSPKTEWIEQLNLLRVLAVRNGKEIKGLQIIAILRDHQMAQAKRDFEYPQLPVVVVDIPMWSLDEAEAFMLDRVKAHQEAEPEVCTDLERWMTSPVYAHKKGGRKSAIKLYEIKEEADAAALEGGKDHFVEHRKGAYRRCEDYCNINHGCSAYAKSQETLF